MHPDPHAAETQEARKALEHYARQQYDPPADIVDMEADPHELLVGEVRQPRYIELAWQARLRPATGPLEVVTILKEPSGYHIVKTETVPRDDRTQG